MKLKLLNAECKITTTFNGLVVMDNLPAHKVKGVTKIIEDAGASIVYSQKICILSRK